MIAAPTKLKLKIPKKDDAMLKAPVEAVTEKEFGSAALKQLVDELKRFKAEQEATVLAAPFAGISKSIVILGFPGGSTAHPQSKTCPEIVVINPKISLGGGSVEEYETCPLFKKMKYKTRRTDSTKYTGFDVDGNPIEGKLEGLAAREFEHAYKHLFGVMHEDVKMEKASKKKAISSRP